MPMQFFQFSFLFFSLLAIAGCKQESTVVTQQRELTDYDDSLMQMTQPLEWRRVPSTQFRDYNYRFGTDGEVYLSLVSGSVAQNANRWLAQFGQDPVESTEGFEKWDVLGKQALVVEAEGAFQGMGGPSRDDMALIGILVPTDRALVSVKMVGRASEVAMERERLKGYVESLAWNVGDE